MYDNLTTYSDQFALYQAPFVSDMSDLNTRPPLTLRMHAQDNVAIVASAGGLPAGTLMPEGVTLAERVPMGHKFALADIAEGAAITLYFPRAAGVTERRATPVQPARSGGVEDAVVAPLAAGFPNAGSAGQMD